MAGNRQQFTLQFNADTSQAKKAVSDLMSSLKDVTKHNSLSLNINADLIKGAEAAQELETHLRSAVNVNTGQLNLVAFNKSLQQSGQSLSTLVTNLANAGSTGQQAFINLATAISQTQVPLRQTNALINNMMTTLKNTVKWELSSSVVHGLEGALSGAVSYVKDLNSSLTDIRIVTGQSVEDMSKFAEQANRAAKELSTTTKAYADASLIYYQQGDSQEQVAKKAALTIKAANASFNTSAAEMSEYLTAVWNSYQAGADELEHYVDIMAALGAKTATSLEEIATSMQKVAATANTVGVSMEQVSSIIATVSSVTRESAESIGTSYKTIFARMGDLKLGKTLEDGVGLGQVSKQLDSIGISILDATGDLREMGDIITDLGNKWQTMSSAEKTATAQVVAGKRQYTQLMALFENWDMYQENMGIAENSEGSLEQMAKTYAESWEAASNRVKASMETIYSALINDQAMIKMTNVIAEITNGVGGFIKTLGGAKGALSVISAILLKTFSGKIVSGIANMTNSIANLIKGPAKQYAAILAQTNKVLGDTADGQNKASISSTSQLIALKQTLLEKEQYLTTSQQMTMQAGLDAYAGQIAKLRELETVYEDIGVDLDGLAIKLGKLGGAQLDGLLSHLTTVSNRWSLLQDSSFVPTSNKAGALTTQVAKNWTKASVTEGVADNAQEMVSDTVLNNLDNATQKTNQYAKALEQLKQVTEGTKLSKLFDGFDAAKLANGEQKVQDLRNAISQLSKAAEVDAAALSNALKNAINNPTLGDELINSLKEIQQALSSGQIDASEAFARMQQLFIDTENRAESLKKKLASLPTAIQKVTQSSAQIASGLMSAVSAGNALANAVTLAGDESASTAEKIGAFASFASVGLMGITSMISAVYSLATAFGVAQAAAGWIGLIGAAIAAVVTGITYAVQKAEKEVQAAAEQISEDLNKTNTKNQTQEEENQSAQNLLKTYNELYEQYLRGEDVQDELAASAQALAEAYGITGAAVAAMTGDYEAFNQVLLNTLKISDLITEDEGIISASAVSWQGMASNKKSGVSSTSNTVVRQQTNATEESGTESLYTAAIQWHSLSGGPYDLMTQYIDNAIIGGLIHLPEGMELQEYVNQYFEALYPNQSNMYTRHGHEIGKNTILTPDVNSWETFLFGENSNIPWEIAYWIDETMALAHSSSSLGTETRADGNTYYSDQYDLTGGMTSVLYQQDDSYTEIEETIPLGSKYGKYLSDDNIIYWDENADIQTAYETYVDYSDWYTELITEKNRLLAEDADADVSYLTELIDQLEPIVKNSDYETLFGNYGQALARKAANETALANIQFLVGRNEENTDFNSFLAGYQAIESTVRQNSADYVELKDLDPVADKEEYDAAVQKIAMGLMNDYTSFDDYVLIYSSLAESFTGDNFDQALAYIQHNKIKSASEVDGSLLQAMEMALNLGQELIGNALVDSVLAANQAAQTASDSRNQYERMLAASETFSEDMSIDEAEAFYDTYWNAGIKNIMAWEDFILLDYEARKAYIDSITNDYLKTAQADADNAKVLAEAALTNWQTAYSNLYGAEDSSTRKQWTDASAHYQDFESGVLKNYVQQEDGTYKYVGPEGAENSGYTYLLNTQGVSGAFNQYYKDQTGSDTNLSQIGITAESIEDYNEATATGITLTNEFNDATAKANGFDLITSGAESATSAMQRLVNAIQKLPTDSEELRKIADALYGGDINALINSTEAERAAAVAAMDAPTLAQSGKRKVTKQVWDETYWEDEDGELHMNFVEQEVDESYSTDQDYADYAEQTRLYQEANALNAQYIEQGIRDSAIETLATIEELSSALSSIDISNLPEQGTKAYEQLQKALAKVNISMADFMEMNDSSKYAAIAKAQNKLIDEEIAVNRQLQEHYASIMNDTSGKYDEATRMEATQNYYNAVTEGNNLILQQEQNIANARAQAAEVYAQQADLIKARMEDLQEQAEKMKDSAEIMSKAILNGELSAQDKTKFTADELKAWNNASSAAERAAIATSKWSSYAAEVATSGDELVTSYGNAQKKLDKLSTTLININDNDQSDVWSYQDKEYLDLQNKEDYLAYLKEFGDLTEAELGHVGEAWDNLIADGVDLTSMTNGQIIEALKQELIDMGVDVTEATTLAAAMSKDAILEVYAGLGEQEQALAAEFVAIWEQAFKTVASLRSKILMGEDIMSDLTSSFENFNQIANSYTGGADALVSDFKTGTVDVNKLNYGTPEEYAAALKRERGADFFALNGKLDRVAAGRALGITQGADEDTEAYYDRVEQAMRPYLEALLEGYDLTGTGFDTVDELINSYFENGWGGEAWDVINAAADKIYANADKYAELVYAEQAMLEAKQARDAEMEENTEKAEQADAYAKAADSALSYNRGEDTSITDSLTASGINLLDFAQMANQVLGRTDLTAENLDQLTDDDLNAIYTAQTEAAQNFYNAVTAAADAFLAKFTGDGEFAEYEGSEFHDEATEVSADAHDTGEDYDAGVAANNVKREQAYKDNLTSEAGFETFAEFEAYAEHLNSMIDAQYRFDTATEEGKKALYDYAKAVAKAADGFEDLQSITEDTWKTLKDGSKKGSKEWIKGIESLRKTTSKVFNTDMKYITGKFVEDHLDELEKMANGTEEEAMAAQDAIENDLVEAILKADGIDATAKIQVEGYEESMTTLELFQNSLDQYDDQDIGFTITPNVEPALAAMSDLLSSGTMTAEQITAALNSIGWQPNIQYMEHEVTEQDKSQGYASTTILGKTYTTTISEDVEVGSIVKIPYIASASKMSAPGGGARPSGGGGGGGGGGGKPKKIDKKDSEDHKERYHPVEQQLERVSDALEKVDKMKRRAFGESHIKAMESEIGLLKDEIKLQEEYLRQAKEYLALDAQRVASLGGVFDSQGNIANYDELIDSIVAKYNAFVDKYNAASASEQENMEEEKEKMDEWFEDAMEWISQYEETLNLIGDKQNEILELQNQISEKTLEKIQYKVEYKVEINEAEKDYLDYINDKYDEVLEKQDLLMDNYIRQGQIAEQNLSYLTTARQELEAAFAAGDLNQADYVAGLQEIQSQILDNLEAIQEAKEAIEELYGKTLELASEELDKHTAKIDAASEAMGSYMSILQLMGKGQTFEDLLFFYEKQYDYNMASLESQMSYLNVLKEEEQYYLARMNSAEGLTETERIQYEALQETMNEVQANILSKTEETLQALKDMYDTTIEDIMKDLEESMVGVGNDLAWLTEEYGFYMEEMEQYVSSQRELYEISKLNRNIQKSINDTTSSVHKKQLKALQDEINAQSELKELSEYEIEMMNLKYELLLKQIALEEAQNAKSTVRLTRDSEGNMVYQYTADQDAINQAQQEYEDVLQQMADTNWEYEQDIYNQTLQLRQDTLEAIKEIAMDETLTEEQKQQRINEILEHYYERSRYLQEQYNIVSENTMTTNELIADHYGIAVEEITDRTKGTIAEIIGEMINDTDNYRDEMETAYDRIKQAMSDYATKIEEVTALTNTSYGSMIESVKTYDKVTEDAKNETVKMTDSLRQEVSQIHATTTAWDNYISKLNSVIGTYESMYLEIQKVIQAQAKLAGASVGSTTTTTTKTTTTTTKKDTTTKNNDKTGSTGGKTGGTGGTGTQDKSSGLNIGAVLGAVVGGVVGGGVGSKVGGTVGAIIGSGVTSVAGAVVGNKLGNLIKDKTGKKYATGGLADYTGPAWVDGTKSRPELVLNQDDTQKLLDTIKVVNKLDQATLTMMDEYINLATAASRANMYNLHAGTTQATKETELQQQVHITAEFPNVQDSNEIQDAFDNLINRAAQYIGSKR